MKRPVAGRERLLSGLWLLIAVGLIGFGLKTVLTRHLAASGSSLRGAPWSLDGNGAVLMGAALALLGLYILYLLLRDKER